MLSTKYIQLIIVYLTSTLQYSIGLLQFTTAVIIGYPALDHSRFLPISLDSYNLYQEKLL